MTRRNLNTKIALMLLTVISCMCFAVNALAATRTEIEAGANDAIKRFRKEVGVANELTGKALGILIFPSVIKAGLGIGGEYGEGVLRLKGKTTGYYSTAAASIGLQIGAQSKTIIMLFMTQQALSNFQQSKGWEVGVNGSVALVTIGAGGQIDTKTLNQPIIAFIFGNKGLMYNLTLEGSKITRIKK